MAETGRKSGQRRRQPEKNPRQRPESTQGQVIAVIGMHRSGTSLSVRALQALGVGLGSNLSVQPAPDNLKGHWEDRDVLQINGELLETLALRWELIGADDAMHMESPGLQPLVERARSLVRAKIAESPFWAFKDPRTARLWPFWRRVLLEYDEFRLNFVWAIRRPWAVAQSLALRNGLSSLQSHLLWLNHNLAPFADIAANQHVVIDYDRMLDQPKQELERMADALRLQPVPGQAIEEFIGEFLDADLRHFGSAGETPPGVGVELTANRAYRALLKAATNAGFLNAPEFLAQWREVGREAAAFFSLAPRLDAATLVEQAESRLFEVQRSQSEESGRRLEDLGRRLEASQRSHSEAAAALQSQFSATLREQSEESGRRLEDLGRRLEASQRSHSEAAAALQSQFSATLREQSEESGRRLEDLGRRLEASQRSHSEAAAALQSQFSATLREQSEESGRRLEDLGRRLEASQRSHSEAAAALQSQFSATLEELEQRMEALLKLLNRERYTIFKPLLRWSYRLAIALVMKLPVPMARYLRRWKRGFLPRAPALTVEFGHPASPMPALDLGQPSPEHQDVLICPVIDWRFRFQRPQQLARQLAELGHRVFYLSTTFDAADAPGFRVLESPMPNVYLIRLGFPGKQPIIYQDLLRDQPLEHLLAALGELSAIANLSRLMALVNLPFWWPLAAALPGCLVVYDCMDYHAGFSSNSPGMLQEEERLLKRADLVVTTSSRLSKLIARVADNLLIRNAGEIEYFSETPDRLAYPSEKPVAGYLGAIADWFDIDLIAEAARQFVDWDFVLVGSTDFCDTAKVEKLGNVKLIGEVPYEDAASWVHSFNVALIPFKLTELTLCTNPVKAYEYLAAGKPVVATALPEMKLMGEVTHVADSHEHFIELLGTAMAERDVPELAARRIAWARQHDWKARAQQLQSALRDLCPKVSVIVLTYNNLSFTRACLQSLEASTDYPDWELILVDNASNDGTREFLVEYAACNAHAKLLQNEENLGFAAGNNQGLAAAKGEYMVILNNDTYVTPGWLVDLIRHLRKDPQLGLAGPVTNNIGNEAKIDIHYADMTEMRKAAWAYTSKCAGEELEVPVVAFFCVAIARAAYAKVGGLDERFGLGFFEDDDYCQRVRNAGFRVAVAEDVFVHHHLSASFDLLDEGRRQALFERNRALYEEKWGAWTPHKYRS